jgi:hypothetical protein
MAETAITAQQIAVTGTTATFEAANVDGNKIDMRSGIRVLHVKNANAATRTVTLVTSGTVAGLAIADRAVVIPALTGDVLMRLDDVLVGTDGFAHVTYSAVTDVTVAVKYV